MNIPLPQQITGSDREQLEGMKTYLFRLAQELQFALGTVEKQMASAQNAASAAERRARGVSESQSPKAVFSSLKALIIKSADIVDAYYEEINRRLEGLYVAQSDFGVYRQATRQDIQENADGISRAFTNLQIIESDMLDARNNLEAMGGSVSNAQQNITAIGEAMSDAQSDIQDISTDLSQTRSDIQSVGAVIGQAQALLQEVYAAVIQVNAWIKTGKLGEDENSVPFYGVEIGQQTQKDGLVVFQKFARLLSDRLSFFDRNGVEVSYIGDETMHITQAEVLGLTAVSAAVDKLRMGDYVLSAGKDGHLTLS